MLRPAVFFYFFLLLFFALDWAPSLYAATRLVMVPADSPGLAELGLALDHSTLRDGRVIFEAGELDLGLLAGAGIPVEVLIEDLEAFYAARSAGERRLVERAPHAAAGFGFGAMGGYYTWAEVVAKLDEMRAGYPQLITAKQSLGLSHEGRDVWVARISDHADQDEGEPSMLFTALTHAREPQGMATILYFMFYLLENYGIDPEATYLVDERQLYFVPVVNPDGYVHNQITNPSGGGLWRKNRRDNGAGSFGVDLNRNYSFNWGYDNQGSSPDPNSLIYRGPEPFSEPETQAIRLFHLGRTIWNALHYHSYGRYEIHPFGHQAGVFPAEPDLGAFLLYGGAMSSMNGYTVGNAMQTVHYRVNGDAVDWSYGETVEKNRVFAFLPEVGDQNDGFWPQPSRIVPLAEENRGPNIYYAWITGARAEWVGITAGPSVPAGATSTAVVELANVGLGTAATDVSLSLESEDPYVTIADPVKPFPPIAPRGAATNAGGPLEFFVTAAAPPEHVIAFDLTVRQGPVVRVVETLQVTVDQTTTMVPDPGAPVSSGLRLAARPNPMAFASDITFHLPEEGPARLRIVDVAGRVVRDLASGRRSAGEHRLGFDGRDQAGGKLPQGVYLMQLEAAGRAAELRLVVLR